jgi:hypothetical protein
MVHSLSRRRFVPRLMKGDTGGDLVDDGKMKIR